MLLRDCCNFHDFRELARRRLPGPIFDYIDGGSYAEATLAAQREERLSVRDMMARDEFGAPATIHGRLKSMREKGWITLADTEDARRKQVALTRDAVKHFERLSKCMVQAAKGV